MLIRHESAYEFSLDGNLQVPGFEALPQGCPPIRQREVDSRITVRCGVEELPCGCAIKSGAYFSEGTTFEQPTDEFFQIGWFKARTASCANVGWISRQGANRRLPGWTASAVRWQSSISVVVADAEDLVSLNFNRPTAPIVAAIAHSNCPNGLSSHRPDHRRLVCGFRPPAAFAVCDEGVRGPLQSRSGLVRRWDLGFCIMNTA